MKFAISELEKEFLAVHPDTRELAHAFELWSVKFKLPEPCITAISRTLEWYTENKLPPLPDSWHLFDSAIDFRVVHYGPGNLALAIQWWEQQCRDRTRWELITKLHGTGPHIHVARRDHKWKEGIKNGSKICLT